MERLANAIIRLRWVIIVLVTALTIFAAYQLKNLRINSDIISSLPDSDPNASLLKEVGEKFGGNKMGMVILETDYVFKTEVLEDVMMITDTIREMDGILSVTSLTNILDIKSGEDGLEIGKLVDTDDLPDTLEELKLLEEKVMAKDLYKGNIVSADATATLILFTLLDDANVEEVANQVLEKTKQMNLTEQLYFAGSPMLVSAISDLISADLYKLIPISFLVIATVLFLSFRSKRGVFLPLLTAAVAIVWTLGGMALLGYKMSMISNNIPILLLAIGSAYSIHVLNRIAEVKETDKAKLLQTTLTHIFIPVVFAALTTMIGFVSFIFGSYLSIIKDFGIFTALGTMFSVILSLAFVPSMIAVFPKDKPKKIERKENRRSLLTEYILIPLKDLLFKHPKYILTGWGIFILLSIIATGFIKKSVNIQDYFKKGNPARVAEQLMEEKFGGSKPVFVVFTGDMQSPDVLNTMLRAEEYMKQSKDIMATQSVADLLVQLTEGLGEGSALPESKEMIEQLWFLIEGNEMLARFVSEDLTQGVIISKFISPDNKSKVAFSKYMNAFIEENSREGCQIQVTGMPFIDVTMSSSLLRSQIGSLVIAIIFVIIIVGFIVRSFFGGVFASIPIIASTFILFGVMGAFGIPLNMATVLVASVAIGVGVDYSIHVISNFNSWTSRDENLHDALQDTILISGKAIVINVASVAAGFLVLLFSEMVPLQYFGLLIGISMVGSSLAALTLLPVILILIQRKKSLKTLNFE